MAGARAVRLDARRLRHRPRHGGDHRSALRKLLLLASLVGNLGLLCYFKYVNFFLHSLQEAAGAVGINLHTPVLAVILPVGISFYTFEAINYTVDVYRGKVRGSAT